MQWLLGYQATYNFFFFNDTIFNDVFLNSSGWNLLNFSNFCSTFLINFLFYGFLENMRLKRDSFYLLIFYFIYKKVLN